jgi:hypothetical protein
MRTRTTALLSVAAFFVTFATTHVAHAQSFTGPASITQPTTTDHCVKIVSGNTIADAGANCGVGTAPSPANPTATIGASAVNGSATTFMRSDAAPALPATLPAVNGSALTNLNGSNIATGTVPAARGGAGAINGALKANGSGVVSQAACADLSNATAACSGTVVTAQPWTPADASGAALVFTSVSAGWSRAFNMVFAYAQWNYPVNANATSASFSGLPVALPAVAYAGQCTLNWSNSTATKMLVNPGNSVASFYTSAGASVTNAQLSGSTVSLICIYPAS